MAIKVGVIFGGETVEHEVSIISAIQAIKSMDAEKYEVIPIYISKDRIWYAGHMLADLDIYRDFENLKRFANRVVLCKKDDRYVLQRITGFSKKEISDIDVILPIVHGNNVEDGSLQGYLETVGVPYVGSNVLGSALGQDKVVMKQIMEATGIPYVPYVWFYDTEYLTNNEHILKDIKKLGYPVVVKPATLGSSIGITIVKDEDKIDEAVLEAIKYDTKVVIEKKVENLMEINCSVLGNYEYQETSALEQVISADEFLTYRDKYLGNTKGGKSKGMASTNRIIPAKIDEKMTEEIKDLAKKTFTTLNLSGVCRIDFLVDKKSNHIYVNEPNTIPGSLSFYLWDAAGKEYHTLLDDLITLAIKEYKNNAKKINSFNTNILSCHNGLKGVKGSKGMKGKLR